MKMTSSQKFPLPIFFSVSIKNACYDEKSTFIVQLNDTGISEFRHKFTQSDLGSGGQVHVS